jgi:hypothetical protein
MTFGLEQDPVAGLEAAIGFVEETARHRGRDEAVQASIGVSDGTRLWAVRYATAEPARTVFASADVASIQRLHPDNPRLRRMRQSDRLVVSEPFAELPGVWHEVPEATAVVVAPGGVPGAPAGSPASPHRAVMPPGQRPGRDSGPMSGNEPCRPRAPFESSPIHLIRTMTGRPGRALIGPR